VESPVPPGPPAIDPAAPVPPETGLTAEPSAVTRAAVTAQPRHPFRGWGRRPRRGPHRFARRPGQEEVRRHAEASSVAPEGLAGAWRLGRSETRRLGPGPRTLCLHRPERTSLQRAPGSAARKTPEPWTKRPSRMGRSRSSAPTGKKPDHHDRGPHRVGP